MHVHAIYVLIDWPGDIHIFTEQNRALAGTELDNLWRLPPLWLF